MALLRRETESESRGGVEGDTAGFNEANALKWDPRLLYFAGALMHTDACSEPPGAGGAACLMRQDQDNARVQ